MNLTNPFPGLRPFEPNETNLFFGRERHIQEIIRKLNTYRFVSVVGNSGSGKSSLVKAGVLPEIKNNLKDYKICVMRPGNAPILELSKALIASDIVSKGKDAANEISEVNKTLSKGALGLVQVIRPNLEKEKKLLLVVDQFEELFRYENHATEEEVNNANLFVNLLLGAINQKDVPIYVMMTIRTDFLGDCEQFLGLPEAINDGQFLVPRMNKEEIQSCLTGPVNLANGKISPRLVGYLSNAVGSNSDQLPILQHVMMRTWERWIEEGLIEQPMDLKHYEATGGMKMALSNHAEEAYAELKSDRERAIAEVLFKTITVKGADNRGVRRPTPVSTIAKIAEASSDEVIAVAKVFRLHGRGFIMPPISTKLNSDSILDISHESLMRVWGRLRQWVEDEGDSADLYTRITASAILYQQGMSGLWRDPDLQIALDWLKLTPNETWASQYNEHFAAAMRFIEASEQEKLFAKRDRQRNRKIRNMAVLGVLFVLSLLSVWAFMERNNASLSAKVAIDEKNKANEQKQIAETSLIKAEQAEQKALRQTKETEKQKLIAEQNEKSAKNANLSLLIESKNAITARNQAEQERLLAQRQRRIADSLRSEAESATAKENLMRIRSISQNLAIRSKLISGSEHKQRKALLALQAHAFNKQSKGNQFDHQIYLSLFDAYRSFQNANEYTFNYHNDAIKTISFDKANRLLSAGSDGIIIRNEGLGKKTTSSEQKGFIYNNISCHSSGVRFAISNDLHGIQVYNNSDVLAPTHSFESVHSKEIIGLDWWGDKLVSAGLDNQIKILDLSSSKVQKTINLAFTPMSFRMMNGENSAIVGSKNGDLYRVNLVNEEISILARFPNENIISLDITANNDIIALGTNSGYCALVNSNTGKVIIELSGHTAAVRRIKFSSDGMFLATACLDSKARMFIVESKDGRALEYTEHSTWVLDVAFSPDGQHLASSSNDKTIRTYPINLDAIVRKLENSVSRNLTQDEWVEYIGEDIPYQKTVPTVL